MIETIQHEDGRVELNDEALREIEGSALFNEDLAPVPVVKRNWTTYNYAALWISMAHCIPTYMMASGLISAGMNWWQALFTILLGNVIVLAPILLNSHPGTKYGIPFPVFARAAYGTVGSNLPALMRAIVACGWFGIQAWIGGQALQRLPLPDGAVARDAVDDLRLQHEEPAVDQAVVARRGDVARAGRRRTHADRVAFVPHLLGDEHRDHL